MTKLLLVGLGGGLGSMLRYGVGSAIQRLKGASAFPFETLVVNVSGCLVIGVLAGLAESRGAFSPATRALLFVGLLGGFTTFSAFGLETFQLVRDGQWASAVLSTCLQVGLGLGAVAVGHALARSL